MTESKKTKNKAYYINSVICVALMIFVGFLPSPIETITPLGMRILGIFVGLIYGWIFVDLVWPSFLSFLMLGFSGTMNVTEAFVEGFGSTIYLQVMMLFLVAAYFEQCGLTEYIAKWFVSLKINVGRPWVLSFMLFICAIVLSCTVSYFAGMLILWSIFYKICDIYDFKLGDAYTGFMVGGMMYVASVSTALFPFTSYGIIVQGLVQASVGEVAGAVPVGPWTLLNVIVSLAIIMLYMAFGKFVLKIDLSRMKEKGDVFEDMRKEKMTHNQKVGLIYMVVFIIMLMGGTIFPSPLKEWFANLGILGACAVCVIGMVFIRNEEGISKCTIEKLSNGLSWKTLILMAATMPMATALEMDEVGVINTVVTWLTGTFSQYSSAVFLVIVVVLFALITQFVHNMVLLFIFCPVLCQTCVALGISPWLFAVLLTLALQISMATPAASTQSAMVFANSNWITTKQAYTNALTFVAISVVVLILSVPIGMVIFG